MVIHNSRNPALSSSSSGCGSGGGGGGGGGDPDSKFYGADMGSTWGQQDPGGPHVGPTNIACYLGIYCFHIVGIVSAP